MTRDEMIKKLEAVALWTSEMADGFPPHSAAEMMATGIESDVDAVLAALRAPAVTGEVEQEIAAYRAGTLAGEPFYAPPAAGAPPALVALMQRQAELLGQCEAFIAEQFDADDGDSVALSNSILAIRKTLESAVRLGSPAPAPVAEEQDDALPEIDTSGYDYSGGGR